MLLVVSAAAIGRLFADSQTLVWAELLCLTAFYTLEFRKLANMARFLVLLCVALVLHQWHTQQFDMALTATAINRAAFMAFFMSSLGFLQHAASRSPMLVNSGRILVQQPPGRRYLVLTFGAAMFGMLLNLGTIGLLGTMINKGVG